MATGGAAFRRSLHMPRRPSLGSRDRTCAPQKLDAQAVEAARARRGWTWENNRPTIVRYARPRSQCCRCLRETLCRASRRSLSTSRTLRSRGAPFGWSGVSQRRSTSWSPLVYLPSASTRRDHRAMPSSTWSRILTPVGPPSPDAARAQLQTAAIATAEVANGRVGMTATGEPTTVVTAATGMPATAAAMPPTRERCPGEESDHECGDERKDLRLCPRADHRWLPRNQANPSPGDFQ
jgi:hypothetical protein